MSKVRTITPLPPADFTPEMGNYKTLQPFRYWCQKVLPLAYDDSLSYYELLCKVVDYLNKTMEDVETLHGDVTNLHTAYEQLQNYVNMYFSSLDVQQEINNKLNQMAINGELSKLLEPFIPDLVTNWLNENITPTTPIIDKSLLISGAGADAQITGFFARGNADASTHLPLKSNNSNNYLINYNYPALWEDGQIDTNTGENIDAPDNDRKRSYFINQNTIKCIRVGDVTFRVFIYDSNYKFESCDTVFHSSYTFNSNKHYRLVALNDNELSGNDLILVGNMGENYSKVYGDIIEKMNTIKYEGEPLECDVCYPDNLFEFTPFNKRKILENGVDLTFNYKTGEIGITVKNLHPFVVLYDTIHSYAGLNGLFVKTFEKECIVTCGIDYGYHNDFILQVIVNGVNYGAKANSLTFKVNAGDTVLFRIGIIPGKAFNNHIIKPYVCIGTEKFNFNVNSPTSKSVIPELIGDLYNYSTKTFTMYTHGDTYDITFTGSGAAYYHIENNIQYVNKITVNERTAIRLVNEENSGNIKINVYVLKGSANVIYTSKKINGKDVVDFILDTDEIAYIRFVGSNGDTGKFRLKGYNWWKGNRLTIFNGTAKENVTILPKSNRKYTPAITVIDDDTSSVADIEKIQTVMEEFNAQCSYAVMVYKLETEEIKTKLLDLYSKGFDMLYHVYYQRGDETRYWEYATFDKSKCVEDTAKGLQAFHQNGFFSKHVVSPYGVAFDDIVNLYRSFGFETLISMEYGCPVPEHGFRYNMPRMSSTNSTKNTAKTKWLIDQIKETGGWLILVTHANKWNDDSYAQELRNVLQYAVDNGVQINTYTEEYNRRKDDLSSALNGGI